MSHEARLFQESTFATSDREALYFRHWPATEGKSKKVIVLFHRGHEHSGRLQHIVDELVMPDTHFYAWDARGHGQSPGARGYSPSLARSVQDVDEFVRFVAKDAQVNLENIVVIAQSVGALLVSTWVHDYAPKIRGMVLASPAFSVKLYVPFARTGLTLMRRIRGMFYVNSYVKGKFLSHDPERIASFEQDKLITRAIAVNILLDLYKTAKRIVSDSAAITLPTQLLISGDDFVVHAKPQKQFYAGLRSAIKEQHILPGFYHDTLGEKDRALAFDKIKSFIDKLYATQLYTFDYSNEDQWSPSADAYRELQAPPKARSLEGMFYSSLSYAMKTVGRLSKGMRLGYETGFDSGSTLDYVYRNSPEGNGFLGRMLDKHYLNSIGWQGIRVRKVNIQQVIEQAVTRLKASDMPIRVVDIAAGHGRYVLDALERHHDIESILLRDYSELNVVKGRAMIEERGLDNVAQFIKGDAFDYASLATLEPSPTLGIVSGLYELFPDNALIKTSLAGLAEAIPAGGMLVYTGQPWHPQLKTIAYTLTSHQNGIPWMMRVRTQKELDTLVELAGFEKCHQVIDEFGIFTVSLAVRKKY
ncbi:TPA: bifunctional alpha/beta hydrolase/class I SAM-dependent methyltransferase [Enterobacter cloacae]|uniref:bifunctional alpha/beta hydrolase/class I SAM-dependent methyltransferase n=1 Tax=Enterobacter cloacae TaxID=550 RepID=UPI00296B5F52|nr:bifunctional alpha/beta hydrolase/class I SAM-dependent methyltransferase [Enterobacter cloacae]HCM9268374.1 bifunctional alpha/beta hydrolase/class I SAM-dependent methyltransferase [Enterobacter cloacae subsp. cloacae]EJD6660462.1 bifunctional alpha/beta hydrolase/class I SAM-dependent methyltransferase [Enterobacter cloacae]EKX4048900.1 bifunctional alpha/beta hydrolase/class I SAM-dependent methyltransferase [Enterobacter cloacae]EKX4053337.1 bifunctional alpha/beta hydrolase/class I SAM